MSYASWIKSLEERTNNLPIEEKKLWIPISGTEGFEVTESEFEEMKERAIKKKEDEKKKTYYVIFTILFILYMMWAIRENKSNPRCPPDDYQCQDFIEQDSYRGR